MKPKIGPGTYLRLVYSISIVYVMIALSHRKTLKWEDCLSEPLRAIIKVISRWILEVIHVFIDIFVAVLEEKDCFLW